MADAVWLDEPVRYQPEVVDGPTIRRVLGDPRGVNTRGAEVCWLHAGQRLRVGGCPVCIGTQQVVTVRRMMARWGVRR